IMQVAVHADELLLELSQSLFKVCPTIYEPEAQRRLREVLAQYDVRKVNPTETHPDLLGKVDLFLAGKRLEGLSKNTLADYRRHLRNFADDVKKKVEDITTNDIRTYLSQF